MSLDLINLGALPSQDCEHQATIRRLMSGSMACRQVWMEAQILRERLDILDAQCTFVAAVRDGSLSLFHDTEAVLVAALGEGGYVPKGEGTGGFSHLLQLPATTFTGEGLGVLSLERGSAEEQLGGLRKAAAQYAREQVATLPHQDVCGAAECASALRDPPIRR